MHAYVCRNFKRNGKCPYKSKCFFIHIDEDFGDNLLENYSTDLVPKIKVENEEQNDFRKKTEKGNERNSKNDENCQAHVRSGDFREDKDRFAEEIAKESVLLISNVTNFKIVSAEQKNEGNESIKEETKYNNKKEVKKSNKNELKCYNKDNNEARNQAVDTSTSMSVLFKSHIKVNPRPPAILSIWTNEPTEVKIEFDEVSEFPVVRTIVHDGWTSTFYTRTINEYDLI